MGEVVYLRPKVEPNGYWIVCGSCGYSGPPPYFRQCPYDDSTEGVCFCEKEKQSGTLDA